MRPLTADALTVAQKRALGVGLGKLLGTVDLDVVHRAETGWASADVAAGGRR